MATFIDLREADWDTLTGRLTARFIEHEEPA